jgi:hypothetical protein
MPPPTDGSLHLKIVEASVAYAGYERSGSTSVGAGAFWMSVDIIFSVIRDRRFFRRQNYKRTVEFKAMDVELEGRVRQVLRGRVPHLYLSSHVCMRDTAGSCEKFSGEH